MVTIWTPDLSVRRGPRYKAIADALQEDLDAGRLHPGDRLPTHRDLASRLGVTVGTVTRAYAESARRGLTGGEVGRGTFVRRPREDLRFLASGASDANLLNLSLNLPARNPEADALLRRAMRRFASRTDLGSLLDYHAHEGMPRHRAAGAAWIRRSGLEVDPSRILVCGGAQHAMAVTFATLCRPGDVVLTEALTYSGMKALAELLHLRLHGLAMDREGLRPDGFEAACRSGAARVLYTMPTLHNPTTATLPEARRHEITAIARAHDVVVVEDDTYGFLPSSSPPPLASLAPERTYMITSASKSIAPGLRVGFLLAPAGAAARLAATLSSLTWMTSPLSAELAARWIEDGTAERLAAWQRRETSERQRLVLRRLEGHRLDSHPESTHVWLHLPEPWRAGPFVERAREEGVAVSPPEAFVAGRSPLPDAVRICLCATPSREELDQGLGLLAGILQDAPRSYGALV